MKRKPKINRRDALAGSLAGIAAKRWGKLTTRDIAAARRFGISILHETLPPGGSAPEVIHLRTEELIYIIRGGMTAFLDGRKFSFKKGDFFLVPARMKHRFIAAGGGVEALSVFMPPLDDAEPDARMVFMEKD